MDSKISELGLDIDRSFDRDSYRNRGSLQKKMVLVVEGWRVSTANECDMGWLWLAALSWQAAMFTVLPGTKRP